MVLLERDEQIVETQKGRSGRFGGIASLSQYQDISFSAAQELVEEDGVWIARDVTTGIFGSGPNVVTAFRDFYLALREHRDVLEDEPALSPELESQLEYLRRRLA